MDFYVYILYSVEIDKYYIGHTEDIAKRLTEHNLRKNLGARDWELKYKEIVKDRSAAMLREKEIKNKKSRKYLEWLITQAG